MPPAGRPPGQLGYALPRHGQGGGPRPGGTTGSRCCEGGDRSSRPERFYLLPRTRAWSRLDLAADDRLRPTGGELRAHYAGFFDPGSRLSRRRRDVRLAAPEVRGPRRALPHRAPPACLQAHLRADDRAPGQGPAAPTSAPTTRSRPRASTSRHRGGAAAPQAPPSRPRRGPFRGGGKVSGAHAGQGAMRLLSRAREVRCPRSTVWPAAGRSRLR